VGAVAREDGTIVVRSIEGRGTAVTISVPDGSTIHVRTFRSPASDLLFAVDASWSISESSSGAALRFDPVDSLALRRGGPARYRTAVFARGHDAFELAVRSVPTLSVATRLFSPDPESATEVLLVGQAEAILLRLDRMMHSDTQTTMPPPLSLAPNVSPV
jgi:hypothetical protein